MGHSRMNQERFTPENHIYSSYKRKTLGKSTMCNTHTHIINEYKLTKQTINITNTKLNNHLLVINYDITLNLSKFEQYNLIY